MVGYVLSAPVAPDWRTSIGLARQVSFNSQANNCCRAGLRFSLSDVYRSIVHSESPELVGSEIYSFGRNCETRRVSRFSPQDGDPDAGRRGGHSLHPRDAWPCTARHHANLYPRFNPKIEAGTHSNASISKSLTTRKPEAGKLSKVPIVGTYN
jgi:hypothetical protein